MLQTENDDHIPLYTGMQKGMPRDLQECLGRRKVQLEPESQLKDSVTGRVPDAAKNLVAIGFIQGSPRLSLSELM